MPRSTTKIILEMMFDGFEGPFTSPPLYPRNKKRGRPRKYHINVPGKSQSQVRQSLWQLRKRELISFKEDGDNVKITLTKKGRKKVLKYNLDEMKLKEQKKWNGKWYVVAFDIPKHKHKARTALSRKFKDLGMLNFQKSVWLYPFPCKDEVDFVAEIFKVSQYIFHIEANEITNDLALRDHFGLTK